MRGSDEYGRGAVTIQISSSQNVSLSFPSHFPSLKLLDIGNASHGGLTGFFWLVLVSLFVLLTLLFPAFLHEIGLRWLGRVMPSWASADV